MLWKNLWTVWKTHGFQPKFPKNLLPAGCADECISGCIKEKFSKKWGIMFPGIPAGKSPKKFHEKFWKGRLRRKQASFVKRKERFFVRFSQRGTLYDFYPTGNTFSIFFFWRVYARESGSERCEHRTAEGAVTRADGQTFVAGKKRGQFRQTGVGRGESPLGAFRDPAL